MPTTPRPDPRRPRTRRAILTATETLVAERGIAATSIADIAERADVSVGSIYGHFQSKDLLLLALVAKAVEDGGHEFDPPPATASSLDRAVWLGESWLAFSGTSPVAARVVALFLLEPPHAEAAGPDVRPVLNTIDAIRAIVQGDVREALEGARDRFNVAG